jgi:hypothetical protein
MINVGRYKAPTKLAGSKSDQMGHGISVMGSKVFIRKSQGTRPPPLFKYSFTTQNESTIDEKQTLCKIKKS